MNTEIQQIENLDSLRSLSLMEITLRDLIKFYKIRASEIEKALSLRPDEWGRYQSEFNDEVNLVFRQIMNFAKINHLSNPAKVEKLKQIFTNRIRKIFLKGVYNAWSLKKPFGYAGDFKIVDDIYFNAPPTTGFERLFDNYFQMSAISVAVRNRKEDFKRFLINFINQKNNQSVRIMNLASGPCREIHELFIPGILENKNVIFDCYDHDQNAIDYARKLLNYNPKVNFYKENALRIAAARDINLYLDKKYDFIYSTGLFDYLNHKVSIRLVSNLKHLLKQGGILAVSDVRDKFSNPSVYYMEWVGDWNLIYNDDEEFRKVFIGVGFRNNQLKFKYEQQGIMQYVLAINNSQDFFL